MEIAHLQNSPPGFREPGNRGNLSRLVSNNLIGASLMAKPHRKLKKANHGSRPANAKARKQKRRKIKT
jgi:hypothetical protein